MNDKTRSIIMIGAGVYIGYLGYQLISGFLNEGGSSPIFLIAGILFMVFAVAIAILYGKKMFQPEETTEEEDEIIERLSDDEALEDINEIEDTNEALEDTSEGEEPCE